MVLMKKNLVKTFVAALIKIHCCLQRLDSERSFNNFFHKQYCIEAIRQTKKYIIAFSQEELFAKEHE